MNVVLILAGGVGERSGQEIPKQFVEINNKPLIVYTIEKFQQCMNIDRIYVSCIDGWQDYLWKKTKEYNLTKVIDIVKGGSNGLQSVANGLKAMNDLQYDDLVLIHDAVRPFIDNESICNNISIAEKYGNAVCTVDLVETLLLSEDGMISSKTVSRDHLKRVLTPQTFRFGELTALYSDENLDASKFPSTFSLFIERGNIVYCSKGSEKNIKITYPEDIEYFKNMFEQI